MSQQRTHLILKLARSREVLSTGVESTEIWKISEDRVKENDSLGTSSISVNNSMTEINNKVLPEVPRDILNTSDNLAVMDTIVDTIEEEYIAMGCTREAESTNFDNSKENQDYLSFTQVDAGCINPDAIIEKDMLNQNNIPETERRSCVKEFIVEAPIGLADTSKNRTILDPVSLNVIDKEIISQVSTQEKGNIPQTTCDKTEDCISFECYNSSKENQDCFSVTGDLTGVKNIPISSALTVPVSAEDVFEEEATSFSVLVNNNSNINRDCTSSSDSDSDESELSEPFGSGGSEADPNFFPKDLSFSSSSDSDVNVPQHARTDADERRTVQFPSQAEKTTRKRKRDKGEWQKNKAKRLRNTGCSYESIRKTKQNDGTVEVMKVKRDEKTILPPCGDKCRLNCTKKIAEDTRRKIFQEFWAMGDLQRQRDFISSCMLSVKPKYRYEKVEGSRRLNQAFHLVVNEQKVRVCKLFFMSTLSINSRIIRTVIEKQETMTKGILKPEMRGKHKKHSTVSEAIKQGVRNHINSIPKIPSHYCRSQTKKEYIEGGKSVADLHRDYKMLCQENNVPYSNYLMYYTIFNEEFNIAFFNPKKDQCELCLAYADASGEEKNQIQTKYDTHLLEKELSRIEKQRDKASNSIVAVFDLQAVLPCPTGNASSYYYVSKLNVFNLTMYELQTNKASCYVWHEAEANRGANEIGSCVWNYLKNLQENMSRSTDESKTLDVIFYTDNCSGQNKNKFIIALYMYAVSKLESLQSVTHKFLITGHTQNEGDHVHAVIEKAVSKSKKSGPIFVPDQYVTIIRQAKKTGNPFSVHEICHKDIIDFKDLSTQIGIKNIFKNLKGETVKMSDIKILMIKKGSPGKLFYKTSYDETEFSDINIINVRRQETDYSSLNLKKAYKQKIGITEKKKKGLLSLFSEKPEKRVIPKFYFDYYNRL